MKKRILIATVLFASLSFQVAKPVKAEPIAKPASTEELTADIKGLLAEHAKLVGKAAGKPAAMKELVPKQVELLKQIAAKSKQLAKQVADEKFSLKKDVNFLKLLALAPKAVKRIIEIVRIIRDPKIKEALGKIIDDFKKLNSETKSIHGKLTPKQAIEKVTKSVEKIFSIINKSNFLGNKVRTVIDRIVDDLLGVFKARPHLNALKNRVRNIREKLDTITKGVDLSSVLVLESLKKVQGIVTKGEQLTQQLKKEVSEASEATSNAVRESKEAVEKVENLAEKHPEAREAVKEAKEALEHARQASKEVEDVVRVPEPPKTLGEAGLMAPPPEPTKRRRIARPPTERPAPAGSLAEQLKEQKEKLRRGTPIQRTTGPKKSSGISEMLRQSLIERRERMGMPAQ